MTVVRVTHGRNTPEAAGSAGREWAGWTQEDKMLKNADSRQKTTPSKAQGPSWKEGRRSKSQRERGEYLPRFQACHG